MHKRLRRPEYLPYTSFLLLNDVDAQHLIHLLLLLASESIYHLHTVLVEEKKRLSHYTPPSGDLEESPVVGNVVVVVIGVMSLRSDVI